MALTAPYSFWYTADIHFPGSLPCFLTGTNAAPSLNAMIGPRMNPRASGPTTTSIFLVGAVGMVCDVRWYTKCVMRVSNAIGSRKIGKMSKKTMP